MQLNFSTKKLLLIFTAFLPITLVACFASSTLPTPTVAPISTIQPTIIIPTVHSVKNTSINSITVIEPTASQQGGNIIVSVCYVWTGEDVWELGPSILKYANGSSPTYTSEEISMDSLLDAQPGFMRCVKQTYSQIPKTADLSQMSLEIQSVYILPAPKPGRECETYQKRLDASLNIQGLEIKAECKQHENGASFSIIQKPKNMTTSQTMALIYEVAGKMDGPWALQVILK